MKEDIRYECKLSSDFTHIEKQDFINLFNKIFHMDYGLDWFNWKYIDNIYGDSYIILVYVDNKLIGIRSFWRNDIEGNISYQPCDTAVSKDYRGRGMFSKMSLIALEQIDHGFIYNFPNENSLPGNLKLGWEINKYYYLKFVFNRFKLKNETRYISDDYLLWKFGHSPLKKYHYYKKGGKSYLLYERISGVYYVLGRFNSEYNSYFIRVRPLVLLNYTENKTTLYKMAKNRGTIVSFEKEDQDYSKIDIPIFSGDFF